LIFHPTTAFYQHIFNYPSSGIDVLRRFSMLVKKHVFAYNQIVQLFIFLAGGAV